jgi:hypothetical protein
LADGTWSAVTLFGIIASNLRVSGSRRVLEDLVLRADVVVAVRSERENFAGQKTVGLVLPVQHRDMRYDAAL